MNHPLFCCSSIAGAIEDIDSHEEANCKDSDKAQLKRMVGPAEQMDITSSESVTADNRNAQRSPGKLVGNSSVEQVNQSSYAVIARRRKSTPVRGAGFNFMLSADRSRQLQDLDSLEDDAGRTAPVTNHRQETDYEGKNLHIHCRSSYNILGYVEIINCKF